MDDTNKQHEKVWLERYLSDDPFSPSDYYDSDGDCFERLQENVPFVQEHIDKWVTVYRDRETKRLVGYIIKDVSMLIEKCGLSRTPTEDDEVAERPSNLPPFPASPSSSVATVSQLLASKCE